MALEVGSLIAHYDVTALIGEGGMGQVYQATDTKLNRQVALKILPDVFAADPDRLARFQREAQVLASLNHPNIAQIHGIEEAEGTRALVLELVEGPTLADRISKGPIPLGEALPIAKQIVEALEAAHEAGVIHRDLKPANIKVREDGTVKVLDFGLAKALDTTPGGDSSESPTLTAAATQMGVIMGTTAYMSPEQARGKPVDTGADVWAFGAVLFEMLSGKRAFEGEDTSLILSAVLQREPDWDLLPLDLPPGLDTFVRRCLHKNPTQRVQAIGDMRLALDGAFETPAATEITPTLRVWQQPATILGLIVVAVLLTAIGLLTVGRPDAIPTGLVQFTIVPPSTAPFSGDYPSRDVVISPDGTRVVYSGPDPSGSRPQLNLRSIDHVAVAPIRGGKGGAGPFVSPDGQWVGFTSYPGFTTLHKVPIVGGPPVTLARSSSLILGASWGGDGQIIYGTRSAGLFRVSDNGGEPEVLTTLDTEAGETSHTWPFIIPGREAIAFVIDDGPAPLITGQLAVLALDTGEITRLGLMGVSPHYVSTGHLVYATADGSLQAVAFDATSLRITGNPVSLVESVTVQGTGAADFSVSQNGRLVYALANSDESSRSLVWVDRAGREEPIPAPERRYRYPRISSDGTRVAVDIQDDGEHAIWVWDLEGETLSRLTSGETIDTYGHWTPDGQRIVFTSGRDGPLTLYWKSVNGTGTAERLSARDDARAVNAVTPDGTGVLAQVIVPQRGRDLVVVSLDGGTETVIFSTEFDEGNAALSPDGEWMAFETDESGDLEIHVRPFPDSEGARRPISTAGGQDPVWSPDGDELFYWAGTRLMTAPIHTDSSSFTRETPQMLFDGTYFQAPGRTYDVAPDGRFLMVKMGEDVPPPQITVVLNWHDELLERVPVD